MNVTEKSYLQDTPHKSKKFSQIQGVVDQGNMIFLTVKVEPEDLLKRHSVGKQYVYLVPKSHDGYFQFQKEAKILLSYEDRMVHNHSNRQTNLHAQTECESLSTCNPC